MGNNEVPVTGKTIGRWVRALDHARLMDTKPFWRVGDFYTVRSPRTGETYEIRRAEAGRHLAYTCTCTAGKNGAVCWHKALVAALPGEKQRRLEWLQMNAACVACGSIRSMTTECFYCDHRSAESVSK
jgi:hypothetical protein